MMISSPVKIIPRFLVAIAATALAGCASDECLDNSSTLPQAAFFSSEVYPQRISLKNLSVRAIDAPGDSELADGSGEIETVFLPFNLDADRTTFLFSYSDSDPAAADRVTFHYSRQPWFVSSACGAVVNFKIEDISHTSLMIDSVTVPGKVITNALGTNINIYFKTQDDAQP